MSKATTILTHSAVASAAIISMLLPSTPATAEAHSQADPVIMRVNGVLRDFRRTNPHFATPPAGGNGHYAGNVLPMLSSNNLPQYGGAGAKVISQWRNKDARPIAPHMYMFNFGDPSKIPLALSPTFNAPYVLDSWDSSLGVYGGTNIGPAPSHAVGAPMPEIAIPTSLQLVPNAGDVSYPVASTLSSDLHCNNLSITTNLTITGNVRILCEGSCFIETGASISLTPGARLAIYIKGLGSSWNHVLIGDPIDPSRVMIYHLGTGSYMIHNHADVYATFIAPNATLTFNNFGSFYGRILAKSIFHDKKSGVHIDKGAPTDFCGVRLGDTAGAFGAASNGGLSSAARFAEWYVDTPGANLSMQHPIDLTLNSDNVFEYLDDAFHPCDGLLFGNEGQSHNNYFTYTVSVPFIHRACEKRFFEFQGCDDAWLFVDGQLAMDLGGIMPGTSQHVDFNRLGLVDGKKYTLNFFYAQRNGMMSGFRLRTNLDLQVSPTSQVVSGGWD